MSDAWVWDMYRPARFVKNVRVLTFKDVNVEELASQPDSRAAGRRSGDGDAVARSDEPRSGRPDRARPPGWRRRVTRTA